MKIGILGTGTVGETLGTKLIEVGHEVRLGSRSANNEKGAAWASKNGKAASSGSFEAVAKWADLVFNCTRGDGSVEALKMAGEPNLAGKVLIDVSNPLDFSSQPATLFVTNKDSLGEVIQRTFPKAKVVKALNTMWCGVMVNPRMLPDTHATFVAGNDPEAKKTVKALLKSFGWKDEEVFDVGDITAARATEAVLPIWIRLMGVTKTGAFNFKVVLGKS